MSSDWRMWLWWNGPYMTPEPERKDEMTFGSSLSINGVAPEDIVKALADADEPLHDEWLDCILCNGDPETWSPGIRGVRPGSGHNPKCPWRMAREYIAGKEATDVSKPA